MKTSLNKFNVLLKKELFTLLIQSGTYIASFIFLFGSAFYYFVLNGFFTYNQTCDITPFFSSFPFLMIAFIPALTFNTFKNETLFLNLALSDFLKILAKFLSIFIIFCVNVLLSTTSILCILRFGNLEFGQIFSALFVILLYGAMLISFSIFIQTIFQNKISQIIVLIVALFVFNSIHILPIYQELSNFSTKILEIFSFSYHFQNSKRGILDTRDVFYFLILTFTFLYSATLIFKRRNGTKTFCTKNVLVYAIMLFLALDANIYYKKFDLTKSKEFSLTNESKNIAKSIINPVNITYVYSKELKNLYPEISSIPEFLLNYSEASSKINVYTKNLENDENLQKKLKSLNIQAQEFSKKNSSSGTISSYYSAIILENENSVKTIPFVLSVNNLEYLVSMNLVALNANNDFSLIVECKNALSLENDYPYLIPFIENSGMKVLQNVDISELYKFDKKIPLLIIGTNKITRDECYLLEEELKNGRNIFVQASPYEIKIYENWAFAEYSETEKDFLSMLTKWGFEICENPVLDKNCFEMTMQNQNFSSTYTKIKYPFWPKDENGNVFYWPASIKVSAKNAEILLKTSKNAWQIMAQKLSDIQTNPWTINFAHNEDNETEFALCAVAQGNFPLYFHSGVSEKAKVAVLVDQYFCSVLNTYSNSFQNLNFTLDTVLKMQNLDFFAKIKNKSIKNLDFTKIKNETELNSCKVCTLFISQILVPIILVFGVYLAVFITRKVKNEKNKHNS